MYTQAKIQIDKAAERLADSDPRVRLQAVRNLIPIAVDQPLEERGGVVQTLGRLADDPEAFVRWNVAIALGQIGHESAVPALSKMAGDEHANVRYRAALALGLICHPSALSILEGLVDDTYQIGDHFVVRAFAALSLGQLGDAGGVPALERLANDDDPVVRWHAAVALGDIGDRAGVEPLAKLVEDNIPFVRAHTAIALAQIGQAAGLPYLERLAEDSAPRVAAISGKALESLKTSVEPGSKSVSGSDG